MELAMQWDGNPNIVLDIQTTLGISLPVQVTASAIHLNRPNVLFDFTLSLFWRYTKTCPSHLQNCIALWSVKLNHTTLFVMMS
jgi:hypothetical protein